MNDKETITLFIDEVDTLLSVLSNRIEENFIDLEDAAQFICDSAFKELTEEEKSVSYSNFDAIIAETKEFARLYDKMTNGINDYLYDCYDRIEEFRQRVGK